MHTQSSRNEFVRAFRHQLSWLPEFGDVNPFRLLKPLRPLVYKYNESKMDSYILKIIQERMILQVASGVDEKKKRARPVIDLALDTYSQEETERLDSKMNASFQKDVITHIKTFMFGGHDTSSSLICYAMYALSEHAECLKKFRAECDTLFGFDPAQTAQTAQKLQEAPQIINRLTYTLAVIKETLRLWPPASSVRLGQPGYSIQYDGKEYPTEGMPTLLNLPSYTFHLTDNA